MCKKVVVWKDKFWASKPITKFFGSLKIRSSTYKKQCSQSVCGTNYEKNIQN